MGVYNIVIGYGVIVPVEQFVQIYYSYIKTSGYKHGDDVYELFSDIIKKNFKDYSFSQLGHDAFDSRDKITQLPDKNLEVYDNIILPVIQHEHDRDDLLINRNDIGPLMFIGYKEDLESPNGELGYYLKAPEVIYSLPGIIDGIVNFHLKYNGVDCKDLENTFKQPALFWTFTTDCCCCG